MNPAYTELGAAYAVDPQSDAAIYWTAMFGAPERQVEPLAASNERSGPVCCQRSLLPKTGAP